jgi:CRP/FNR family transcriptional regulator, cyclic AMP receptor protein
MTLSLEAGVLKQIPMFRDVEIGKLKLMAFASERLSYGPGDVIVREGDEPDAVFVVLSGSVDVMRNGSEGPIHVAKLGEGAIVGELSVLCDSQRSASIVATSDVLMLKIEKGVFLDMFMHSPQLAMAVTRELARRLEGMLSVVAAKAPGGTA